MISIDIVDGEWKEWLEWGNCSTSCGGGLRHRQRLCDGPYYGGDNCTGDDIDTESCSEQECPGNHNYITVFCPHIKLRPIFHKVCSFHNDW